MGSEAFPEDLQEFPEVPAGRSENHSIAAGDPRGTLLGFPGRSRNPPRTLNESRGLQAVVGPDATIQSLSIFFIRTNDFGVMKQSLFKCARCVELQLLHAYCFCLCG